MRVLTVVPLPPGPRGGIEDYVSSVLQSLRGRAEVEVLAPAEKPQDPVVEVDPRDGPLNQVRARWMFRRLVPVGRRSRSQVEACVDRAELVHIHMPCPR